jgi:Flp pilus assembly protein TadD
MVGGRIRCLALLIAVSLIILPACSKEKSVDTYLEDGRAYLESGDVSKAIAALEEVVNRDPELVEAHRLLGEALSRSERWPEALKQFEAYQALAQEDATAYALLGEAYARTGDLENAATTFARGVEIDPAFIDNYQVEIAGVADTFLEAGREALEQGDLATATDLLTSVAPLKPGEGEVYILLGQAHEQAGDTIQALNAYANGVKLSPDLLSKYADQVNQLAEKGLEMGQAAMDGGDLNRAAQLMETVVTLLPEEPKAQFLLGNIYNEANRFEQAIEQYQRVLELEPDSASAQTNMGVVYYKMGDLETAIQQFKAALELEPDDAETHYLLGAAYVQQDELEQGKTEFETAITLDEELAPPYIGLGNVYLLQGDMAAALDVLEQAVALNPNSPEAYFALGQVYLQMGNIADARAALEKVLTLNPAPHWRDQVEQMLEGLGSD